VKLILVSNTSYFIIIKTVVLLWPNELKLDLLQMATKVISEQIATTNRPRVGIGVLIIKNSKILLGKRKNAHGAGTWAPPGGHLEFGESLEDCAKREVYEETGLEVISVKRYSFTNDIFAEEHKHYISIFMLVDTFNGEPKALEANKCEYWVWFDVTNLPKNLFKPLHNIILDEQLCGEKQTNQNLFSNARINEQYSL
jgi:8-oxo-dGTP diphosphatase